MTNTEIEDIIYDWINGILSMQAIFAYPDVPRPTTSYVLINFLTDLEKGRHETIGVLKVDDSTDNTYSSLNEVTFSINTYYDGAFQKAVDIQKSLMLLSVRDLLNDNGLGFLNYTQIQKIPEIVDKKWEERAQFDITFSVRRTTTENRAKALAAFRTITFRRDCHPRSSAWRH